jgi:hypothetical protein
VPVKYLKRFYRANTAFSAVLCLPSVKHLIGDSLQIGPGFPGVPARAFQPCGGSLSFRLFPQFDGLACVNIRRWALDDQSRGFLPYAFRHINIILACVFAHASATFTELGDREGDLSIVLRHAGVGADLVVFTTFV